MRNTPLTERTNRVIWNTEDIIAAAQEARRALEALEPVIKARRDRRTIENYYKALSSVLLIDAKANHLRRGEYHK